MTGYIFDKSNRQLVWRKKGVAQVGQGGLAGMMMKSAIEQNAIVIAATKVMEAFPFIK